MLKGKVEDGYIDCFSSKEKDIVVFFYNQLIDYAMYWQDHTPTAFGNPEYQRMEGWIYGFALAKKWNIEEQKNKIIVKTQKGKKIIELEKMPLPESYFKAKKEIKETIDNMLGN